MDSFKQPVVVVQFIRVLQQIAIGYFIAFLIMSFGLKGQVIGVIVLLGGHTLAYWLHGGNEAWEMVNCDVNVGRQIDRWMHQPFADNGYDNILKPSRGYYVAFNAVSSAATILIGVLIGGLLKSPRSPGAKALAILAIGGALFASGLLLEQWLPMVKKIWTASFALYAAGCTCGMMFVFYALIDVLGIAFWAWPFVVVGVNSIFIYFSSGILDETIRNLLKPFTTVPLRNSERGNRCCWRPLLRSCNGSFASSSIDAESFSKCDGPRCTSGRREA